MDSFSVASFAPSSGRNRHSPKRSARRCLFGRSDPERTKQWLNERLEEIRASNEIQMAKWGFDFDADVPCGSASSDYIYTAVPAASVPHFYRFSRYKKEDSSDTENRSPDLSFDSDSSMEDVSSSLPPISSSFVRTPRSPRKQMKLTSYMRVEQRKRLQRSAKIEDLCGPRSPSDITGSAARHLKAASQ